MNLILFILGVVGMTHIMVDSEIMDSVDEWAKNRLPAKLHHGLFECYQCCGFWCGVALGLVLVSVNLFVLFACGCAGSFLADFGKLILDRLEGLHGTS